MLRIVYSKLRIAAFASLFSVHYVPLSCRYCFSEALFVEFYLILFNYHLSNFKYALSKADALSGMRNIMILRPSIEKCLFGIAAMGFPDPGGRERFFF